jgi:hypothetical protein
MITFTTQAAALAQAADQREGDVLLRWAHEGVRTYGWATAVDVDEMLLYGDDDFDVVLDNTTVVHSASSLNVPAHVSTQDWDDRDNG